MMIDDEMTVHAILHGSVSCSVYRPTPQDLAKISNSQGRIYGVQGAMALSPSPVGAPHQNKCRID